MPTTEVQDRDRDRCRLPGTDSLEPTSDRPSQSPASRSLDSQAEPHADRPYEDRPLTQPALPIEARPGFTKTGLDASTGYQPPATDDRPYQLAAVRQDARPGQQESPGGQHGGVVPIPVES